MTPEHKHEFLDEICRGLDGLYPNWNPTMGQQAQWMDCLERKGFDEAVKALKAAYQHPRHNFNKEVPDITIFNQIYSGSSPRGGSAAKQGMVTDTFVQYHGGGHCKMQPGYFTPVHCFLDDERTRTETISQARDMLEWHNGGDWRIISPSTQKEMADQRHEMGDYPVLTGTFREIFKQLSVSMKAKV